MNQDSSLVNSSCISAESLQFLDRFVDKNNLSPNIINSTGPPKSLLQKSGTCSTPFLCQQISSAPNNFLRSYSEYNSANQSLVTTPENTLGRKTSSLPKPSFSNEPVKRRIRADSYKTRSVNSSVRKLSRRISFEFECSKEILDKRRANTKIKTRNKLSFHINDPLALMNQSGEMTVRLLEDPTLLQNDPVNFPDSTSTSPPVSFEMEINRELGNGTSGVALQCYADRNGKYYVVKRYTQEVYGNNDCARLIKEAAALSRLNHPNIVSYIDSCVQESLLFVKMEYCNGFDLQKIIQKYYAIPNLPCEVRVKRFLLQMLKALSHLHSQGVVHYDIKPENIFSNNPFIHIGSFNKNRLVTPDQFDPIDIVFKIGDFSHCFIADAVNIGVSEGDSRYMAMESLDCPSENYISSETDAQRPSPASDVFALGLTTAEYCGCESLPTRGDLWHKIRSIGLLPPIASCYSPQLKSFLTAMIAPDPSSRPSADQSIYSDYFNG